MKLENIGFYTLSDERVKQLSSTSNLKRCELILTDRCNFKCAYCRGVKPEYSGDLPHKDAMDIISYWGSHNLENIRFSGGEPTLYKTLPNLVIHAKRKGIKRVAISTNGSADIEYYKRLKQFGVDDFSISFDACCSIDNDTMNGVKGYFETICNNIRELSKITYVTVGIVINENNIESNIQTIKLAEELGVSDIRVIPSAQFNKSLIELSDLSDELLNKYPILKYRINNIRAGKHVRGISETDSKKCWLSIDDMCIMKDKHFPCIIYMREQGNSIGRTGANIKQDRINWFKKHNTHNDSICKNNCLDVCVEYNNKAEKFIEWDKLCI